MEGIAEPFDPPPAPRAPAGATTDGPHLRVPASPPPPPRAWAPAARAPGAHGPGRAPRHGVDRRASARGRWDRASEDRLLGGVAGGIAARVGVDVTLVRVGFAVVTIFGGFGAAAYLVCWLVMPLAGEDQSIGTRVAKDRQGILLALAFVPALLMLVVLGAVLHAGVISSAAWPLFVCGAGGVLVWRNVGDDERAWLRHAAAPVIAVGASTGRSRRAFVLRVCVGGLLVVAGIFAIGLHHAGAPTGRMLVGAALVVAGVIVVFGPWWIRLARDLVSERQARARAEERADMAARVHDSVLQTLALIQRAADEPHRVVQLARAQERELRAWLFEGDVPSALPADVRTLAAGVRAIGAEVEAAHGTVVDVVAVGDCALDEGLRALLDAAREAIVNAAKWSQAPSVSVFAEVEPRGVSVFVRDRGRGFDPTDVAPDRRGITQSIHGRMLRHGGRAVVRSAPGEGTEIELHLARPEVL